MAAGDPTGGLTVSDFGGMSPLSAGALGVGALGVGSMIAQGAGKLPSQFGQAEASAPWLTSTGQNTIGQGQTLVGQGTSALDMARRGELTPEQQAQLGQLSSGLTNKSRQMFYGMGRNPDADTAAITQQGNDDQQLVAASQQMIQSTIQLGLGEISGGTALMGTGSSEINAANQTLIAAGNAQLQLDTTYSNNLTSAFGAIGKMFGMSSLASKGAGAAGGSDSILSSLGLGGEDAATVLESLALVA